MKQTQMIRLLALTTIVSFAVIGCKTNRYGPTPLPSGKRTAMTGSGTEATAGQALTSDQAVDSSTIASEGGIPTAAAGSHAGWMEDSELFKEYTVHFEYDSTALRASEKGKVEAIAGILKSNPNAALKIAGHCDERGTEEYNRSLGERRALALREELATHGIDPSRVETISFGEDKPAQIGNDEATWRANRRGEFIQLTPPQAP